MIETKLVDVAAAVGGVLSPSAADAVCTGVTIDSRRVSAGDLFVAIVGERVDGNDCALSAIQAGAAGCLVSQAQEPSLPSVLVGDTIAALGALAAHHRRHFDIPIIGITGSNGKTTTKDMVAAILEQELSIVKTQGNQNNEIGMPLTLLRLDGSHGAAVVEMGMRGRGQIASLASAALPTIGVVTNVGDTHIELLGSRNGIRDAKAELVEALPLDGCAVLNCDDELVRGMQDRTKAQLCLYGLTEGAHVTAQDIVDLGQEGMAFRLKAEWLGRCVDLAVRICLPGMHNVSNALAASAAAIVVGMGDESIAAGLAGFEPTAMRMQVVEAASGITVINDTYNASPASTKAALSVLKSVGKGRRTVAVLADMLELGSRSVEFHEDTGREAALEGTSLLVSVGELARSIADGYTSAGGGRAESLASQDEAVAFLRRELRTGDVVLVKGSRGMKMEQVVTALLCGSEVDGGRQS